MAAGGGVAGVGWRGWGGGVGWQGGPDAPSASGLSAGVGTHFRPKSVSM